MPRPRPPSRVETVTFPTFGISWWASPEDGTSIVAYGGGGGKAATGVNNKIVVRIAGQDPIEKSTENEMCAALHLYQNPVTKSIWLLTALGDNVVRYSIPSLEERGQAAAEYCNAVAVNAMADRLAVGLEKGVVALYEMNDARIGAQLWSVQKHVKAVCVVSFAPRAPILASSAKDGACMLWDVSNGKELANLDCKVPVQEPKRPPPKNQKKPRRPQQVFVKGCVFGDLEGKVVYTAASGKKGTGFLSCWMRRATPDGGVYACQKRMECSPDPVSSMSLSADGSLLALGSAEGDVTLVDVEKWKILKRFREVHELPVTCIAARPFALPLQGEEDGVRMHAVSASADSQMLFLTLQRRAPKSKSAKSSSGGGWLWSLLWITIVFSGLYRVLLETKELCADELNNFEFVSLKECFVHTVLIAPATRPGILVPPH